MDSIEDVHHGWVVFDSLRGFVSESSATSMDKKRQDILVWLMNMLAFYCNCSYEGNLVHLDFNMNFMFKNRLNTKWLEQFNTARNLKRFTRNLRKPFLQLLVCKPHRVWLLLNGLYLD